MNQSARRTTSTVWILMTAVLAAAGAGASTDETPRVLEVSTIEVSSESGALAQPWTGGLVAPRPKRDAAQSLQRY